MVEFFSENHLLIRAYMLVIGWTGLIVSSIILVYKASKLHNKIKKLVFGKLIFPTLIGWLVTMYSLGTVSTFYVFDEPKKGMLIAFPVFLLWAVSIIIVFVETAKWSSKGVKEAENLINLNLKLEKANTQLQEIDEMKSEFINIAAHQLRTPLSEIKWTYDFIIGDKSSFLTPEQKKVLLGGARANERIIKIVNNLLEVQKSESGKFGYNFKASSIEKIAEESLKNFMHIAKSKKIEATINKSEEIIPTLEFDQLKIGIVFSILIENAINYTSENGKIEITCKKKNENVEISISDSGIGIPKDNYDKNINN